MKVEIVINGELRLNLTPETQVEQLIAQELAEKAAKGQRVLLAQTATGLTLGLEEMA